MNMSKFSHGPANEAELCELSVEVSRIATTLARLALKPEVTNSPSARAAVDRVKSDISIMTVRNAIRVRRLRSQFFDSNLFADPAWDMLLDLFQAEIAQQRVCVSSLCVAAAVPNTTALRWIKTMTEADLFRRRPDPTDARRMFLELSPLASETMRAYFQKVGE